MYHDGGEDLKARHECTDVPCCLVFLASLVGLGCLYSYGLSNGNIAKLYHGIDYQGKICGIDGPDGVPGKPYLFWCMNSAMTGASLSLNLKDPICVASCPGVDATGGLYAPATECKQVSAAQQINSYKTMVVMNRYCYPDTSGLMKSAADSLQSGLENQNSQRFLEQVSSIPSAWPVLLLTFFVAVLLGYVYLAALRHCASVLIWLVMAFSICSSAFLGVYLWANAADLSKHLPPEVVPPEGFGKDEETATKVVAVLCWVVCGVAICIGCCCHASIQAAVDCIEAACEAIYEMSSLLLAPIFKAVAQGVVFAVLLYGFLALLSTAKVSEPEDGSVVDTMSGQIQGVARHLQLTSEQKIAVVAYFFVAVWVEFWLHALYQFVIAYAMAEYHLSPEDHEGYREVGGGCCALTDGLQVGILMHAGSLAMGSALVTVFFVLQVLVNVFEAANKEETSNPCAKCLLNCVKCCLACFEKIVEFLNKNAYVDIAMTSNNYCTAVREAIGVISRLPVAMAVLNGATVVFTLFGCLFTMICCAAFTFFLTTSETFAAPDSVFFVDAPVAVAVAGGIIGGIVSLCFMTVLDMSTDALLYYYGLDWNDNKRGHDSNAPNSIKELVHGDRR